MTRRADRQHCGNFGPPVMSRREMLQRAGLGFGSLALASMLHQEGSPLVPGRQADHQGGEHPRGLLGVAVRGKEAARSVSTIVSVPRP